jgi:hypothetical protein
VVHFSVPLDNNEFGVAWELFVNRLNEEGKSPEPELMNELQMAGERMGLTGNKDWRAMKARSLGNV